MPLAATPAGAATLTPTAYVANDAVDTLSPIDIATNTAGTQISVDTTPLFSAITPDAKTLYVTVLGDDAVTPVSTATNTALPPIAAGNGPYGIAIAPDGKLPT